MDGCNKCGTSSCMWAPSGLYSYMALELDSQRHNNIFPTGTHKRHHMYSLTVPTKLSTCTILWTVCVFLGCIYRQHYPHVLYYGQSVVTNLCSAKQEGNPLYMCTTCTYVSHCRLVCSVEAHTTLGIAKTFIDR